MNTYRQRWLAIGFGLLISFVIVEIVCRVFPTWHDAFVKDIVFSRLPADLYQPVGGLQPGERPGKVRYQHAPNAQANFKGLEYDNWVYTNSLGFRTSPTPLSSSFEQNILLLGDSFVFGAQVSWQESFVGHLSTLQPSIQFLNAGVDGYNTEDALALWQGLNLQPTPSEVWLFLFWGNDIWENDWRNRHSDNLIPLDGEEVSWVTQDKWLQFLQHSVFLSRLYALWAIQSDERFIERLQQQEMLVDASILQPALNSTTVQLQRFTEMCPSTCRVILIPPADAFETEAQATVTLPLLKEGIPKSLGVVDLYPVLRERGHRSLYFHADPHWNAQGHAEVAEYLNQTLLLGKGIQ